VYYGYTPVIAPIYFRQPLRLTDFPIAPDAMHRWANPKPVTPSAAVERMR
jgi:hypothetical protein